MALSIAVSFYFCLIKYKQKQKHLLPYYVTNHKLGNDKVKWISQYIQQAAHTDYADSMQ